jgi:hypothetical protein
LFACIAFGALPLLCGTFAESAVFRHDGHVRIVKGDCGACHGRVPSAPRESTIKDCFPCHKDNVKMPAGKKAACAACHAAGRR